MDESVPLRPKYYKTQTWLQKLKGREIKENLKAANEVKKSDDLLANCSFFTSVMISNEKKTRGLQGKIYNW